MGGTTSNPRISVQRLEAPVISPFAERRDLIVGQLGVGATATTGSLVQDVERMTDAQIIDNFGNDEMFHRIKQFNIANGGYSSLHVIGLSPSASSPIAATSEIVFTGTSAAAGTITISVVDERQFTVNISVANGDTAAAIATKTKTALDALVNAPFTTAVSTGMVTITATDVGSAGNFYGIKTTGVVAGITYALTGWTGGSVDPTLTGLFDPIDGIRYTGINWPEHWQTSITDVIDILEPRFNANNAILDGVAFMGKSDTFADIGTFLQPLNSQSLVVMGNNEVDSDNQKGGAIPKPASWDSAYFQGVRARRLTARAPIADFIVARGGPRDANGGAHTASLPYFNTPLARTPVTQPTNLFSNQDQQSLEDDGFSTFGVNDALNGMVMGQTVTTRTTDSAGNENVSFHFLNYVDTGSACAEVFFRTLKATFAQSRLTETDLVVGLAMANEGSIRGELGNIYRSLANQGLVQAGAEAEKFFANNTEVTISLATRSVAISSPLPLVTQLGEITYPLTFAFTVEQTGTQITF